MGGETTPIWGIADCKIVNLMDLLVKNKVNTCKITAMCVFVTFVPAVDQGAYTGKNLGPT